MADGAGRKAEFIVSKTDKTRPWWVKEKYDPHLFYDYCGNPWPKSWIGEARCGCRLCTNYYGRKEDRRKQRYAGKREARNGQLE